MSVKIDQSSLHTLPLSGSSGLVCQSYAPGHNVHWIQALHSANHKEVAEQTWAGKVVTIEGEVVTVRKPDGTLARFRTHDPAQLADIVKRRGAKLTVNDQYCIMRAGITRAGSTCISVQADKGEPLEPCKVGDLAPDLEDDDLEDDEVESCP
jgi:hypothetical protein